VSMALSISLASALISFFISFFARPLYSHLSNDDQRRLTLASRVRQCTHAGRRLSSPDRIFPLGDLLNGSGNTPDAKAMTECPCVHKASAKGLPLERIPL